MNNKQSEQPKSPVYRGVIQGERVHQYTEKITEVTPHSLGYDIETDQKTLFLIQTKFTNVKPSVGDIITFHTIRLTQVVGISINEKLIYFLSEKDL